MICTDKFVFIHMHKTGGQSLNHVIEQCMTKVQHIGYHYPIQMLPPEYTQLPIVGMVRNPWDWYISWYAFNTRANANNPLFFILSNGRQADFKQTVRNLILLGADTQTGKQYRDALATMLPEHLEGNQGVGLSKNCVNNFIDNTSGYYSWLFQRMHGEINSKALHIGRFENLQEDFVAIMENLSAAESDSIRSKLASMTRINVSHHSHYSRYYDDELRELVAEKEKLIIQKYDYKFETDDAVGETVEFQNIQMGGINDGFQKLSGKANNYLLLHPDFDIQAIKNKLAEVPEAVWGQSGRERKFEVHSQTQALLLIYDEDFRHAEPTYRELYFQFEEVLKPLIDFIANHYQHNGFVVRLIFAKLKGNGKIKQHIDGVYTLVKCHRVHIPIISNSRAIFMVGAEEKVMREGEVWEINNATIHAVDNQSHEDRVHLIIDWVPDATVREQDKISAKMEHVPASPVGRNSPCPCLSGKKFKHCHGAVL